MIKNHTLPLMCLLLVLASGCASTLTVANKMAASPESFHGMWVHELENVSFWPDGRYSQACHAYHLGGTWKAKEDTIVVTVTKAGGRDYQGPSQFTSLYLIAILEKNLMVVGTGENRREYKRGLDYEPGSQMDTDD
jgi:hypothetical protein